MSQIQNYYANLALKPPHLCFKLSNSYFHCPCVFESIGI